MDYWKECIKEAFEESKIIATEEQLENVVAWVEGAHENYSMANGFDVIRSNYEYKESKELKKLKKENEDRRIYEATTKPCEKCHTSGIVLDRWGRDVECFNCDGKGRI